MENPAIQVKLTASYSFHCYRTNIPESIIDQINTTLLLHRTSNMLEQHLCLSTVQGGPTKVKPTYIFVCKI